MSTFLQLSHCGLLQVRDDEHMLRRRGIDTGWFHERIAESEYGSLRALAPHILGRRGPLDIHALSRMLSGDRAMQLSEARQLADLLGVSLRDVLEHSGIDTRPDDWRRGR